MSTGCRGHGDTGVETARRAGVAAIGYANKPGKAARLRAADAVIEHLQQLLHLLRRPGRG